MERKTSDGEKERESSSDRKRDEQDSDPSVSKTRTVESLHRTAGNQAVKRLYEAGEVQATLSVSNPGDPAEREAERVAKQVMRSPEIKPETESEGSVEVSRKASSGEKAVKGETRDQIESVKSGGEPLSPAARSYFEPRFDRDFSDVRVHTDQQADQAARSIGAEAFTHGSDVVFRSGNYDPDSRQGKKLIAHELTHVVQQTGKRSNEVQRQSSPKQKKGKHNKKSGSKQSQQQKGGKKGQEQYNPPYAPPREVAENGHIPKSFTLDYINAEELQNYVANYLQTYSGNRGIFDTKDYAKGYQKLNKQIGPGSLLSNIRDIVGSRSYPIDLPTRWVDTYGVGGIYVTPTIFLSGELYGWSFADSQPNISVSGSSSGKSSVQQSKTESSQFGVEGTAGYQQDQGATGSATASYQSGESETKTSGSSVGVTGTVSSDSSLRFDLSFKINVSAKFEYNYDGWMDVTSLFTSKIGEALEKNQTETKTYYIQGVLFAPVGRCKAVPEGSGSGTTGD